VAGKAVRRVARELVHTNRDAIRAGRVGRINEYGTRRAVGPRDGLFVLCREGALGDRGYRRRRQRRDPTDRRRGRRRVRRRRRRRRGARLEHRSSGLRSDRHRGTTDRRHRRLAERPRIRDLRRRRGAPRRRNRQRRPGSGPARRRRPPGDDAVGRAVRPRRGRRRGAGRPGGLSLRETQGTRHRPADGRRHPRGARRRLLRRGGDAGGAFQPRRTAGGPRDGPHAGVDARVAGAVTRHSDGETRRQRGDDSGRQRRGRRRSRRPPRRARPGRRRSRFRGVGRRRVTNHWRVRPRRQGRGRRGVRRVGRRGGVPRSACDRRRRRDDARTRHRPRRGGRIQTDRRRAVRRPLLGVLHAGHRRRCAGDRVHPAAVLRRRLGNVVRPRTDAAGRCLPLCVRHLDAGDRRLGADERRPQRRPREGRRPPRTDGRGRHGRLRQDGNADDRRTLGDRRGAGGR